MLTCGPSVDSRRAWNSFTRAIATLMLLFAARPSRTSAFRCGSLKPCHQGSTSARVGSCVIVLLAPAVASAWRYSTGTGTSGRAYSGPSVQPVAAQAIASAAVMLAFRRRGRICPDSGHTPPGQVVAFGPSARRLLGSPGQDVPGEGPRDEGHHRRNGQ